MLGIPVGHWAFKEEMCPIHGMNASGKRREKGARFTQRLKDGWVLVLYGHYLHLLGVFLTKSDFIGL